ncbi:MAG: hypothetical protein ACYC99_01545 [Candidatus Geothermincolia bacterium]
MRRRVAVFAICLIVIAILSFACTVALAQSASVTVTVRVERSIHVSGSEPGRASVKTVRQGDASRITFVSP